MNDRLTQKLNSFNSLFELMQAFPTEKSCIKFLELVRWEDTVVSPFDSSSKVYKCKNNRYHCKNTGKYYVRTNTFLEASKIQLRKWFMAIYLITSHKKVLHLYN